jgi:hypothetical protein
MAIMDWEEGQEKYREQRESDRYYARLYDENEAVRASKAAALAEEEAARQSQATQSGAEERPKTADKIGSNNATEDGKSSPTRIDEITAKTADTVGSTTAPQDGQNERKNTKLTINAVIAPYSGGSEAMQGDQPISGNNTQSDALKGDDCKNGDGAAGSYTNVAVPAPIFTIEGDTTQLTERLANQLLLSNNDDARYLLGKYFEELAEVKGSGCSDVYFDQVLYAVHMSWLVWITDNNDNNTTWNFHQLDARHITVSVVQELKGTLDSVRRRCEEGASGDIGQTLSVIEHLCIRMDWVVSQLKQQQEAQQKWEEEEKAKREEEAQREI